MYFSHLCFLHICRVPAHNFLHRITHYCARSERCSRDVMLKLESWGVNEEDVLELLQILRRENFLNDERFLHAYISEKWKQEQWGRLKIVSGLQQKGFEESVIREAMEIIDQDVYVTGLAHLLSGKRKTLKEEESASLAGKLLRFAMSRGFEQELILQWLNTEGYDLEG